MAEFTVQVVKKRTLSCNNETFVQLRDGLGKLVKEVKTKSQALDEVSKTFSNIKEAVSYYDNMSTIK